MAYRNGTYIAFHANGTTEPTESDIKYYNLLKAWDRTKNIDFSFINSHEKASAVRDSSKKTTLEASLKTRLNNSKNMLLIIGKTTKQDNDWVPFEISYAVDRCAIPIIAAYPYYEKILKPQDLSDWWPTSLANRINNGSAHVIHIPFKLDPISDAIGQFSYEKYPAGDGLGYYSEQTYQSWK
jgi:MTH538 TIR-like domain (DUF1863)